jgi:hypothetical protein
MELRMNRVKGAALLGGVAVTFALIGIAVAPHSSGGEQAPGIDGACAEFAKEVDPLKVPVDTGYDPETDVVYAHHAGRTYVFRPNDPSCDALPVTRALRAHALEAHRQNMRAACEAVSKDVADGRSEAHGQAFDREAAKRFVASRCQP